MLAEVTPARPGKHPPISLLVRVPWSSTRGLSPAPFIERLTPHPAICLRFVVNRRPALAALAECWAPPYDGKATHVLVLEDDALLPQNAGAAMVQVLEQWPTSPVGFFCLRQWVQVAADAGCRYARWKRFSGGVAQCLPVALAEELSATHHTSKARTMDARVNELVERHQVGVIFPVPSIVDHDGSLPSTSGGPSGLWAGLALGPAVDALRTDWRKPSLYHCQLHQRGGRVSSPSWA